MSNDMLNHKLTEAIPDSPARGGSSPKGGPPDPSPGAEAEQTRQEQESRGAQHAQGDVRDRLVDIGKAHHMAGRGNGRVSDQ